VDLRIWVLIYERRPRLATVLASESDSIGMRESN
jgi:hypothetical protein